MTDEENRDRSATYTIKRYKWRRLQPTIFWQIWKRNGKDIEGKCLKSLRYKMITLLVTQRFTQDEIIKVVFGWHKKHGLRPNTSEILKDITAVRLFTLAERRRIKREEMRKYRAKVKAKTLEAAALNGTERGCVSVWVTKTISGTTSQSEFDDLWTTSSPRQSHSDAK